MFSYTTKNGELTVYETVTDFRIKHNQSHEMRVMGDGTDFFDGIRVGTKLFYKLLIEDIERSQSIYMEAYFPDAY